MQISTMAMPIRFTEEFLLKALQKNPMLKIQHKFMRAATIQIHLKPRNR
jgi:hypothetical protein